MKWSTTSTSRRACRLNRPFGTTLRLLQMPTTKYTDWFPSPHCVRTIRTVLHTVSRLKRNRPLLSVYLRRAIALLRSVFHVGCGEHKIPQPNPINLRTAAEFIQPLYNLLPADTRIVVLDTSAARNLAHTNTPPPWVNIFAEMSLNKVPRHFKWVA
jgi:hypothetical protein